MKISILNFSQYFYLCQICVTQATVGAVLVLVSNKFEFIELRFSVTRNCPSRSW